MDDFINKESKDRDNSKEQIKDLLLEDHKYFQTSFWKNEESGETRVRFYLTLVTAVLAAIATLITSDGASFFDAHVLYITAISLISLLFFGVITLLRMIKRNVVTDEYKKGMDEVRKQFRLHYDVEGLLDDYKPFEKPPGRRGKRAVVRTLGGLTHTVSVINSVIFSILLAIPFLSYGAICALLVSTITVVLGFLAQYRYIKRSAHCNKTALERGKGVRISTILAAWGWLWLRFSSDMLFYGSI